jgi:hypothetical protein
MKIAIVSAFLLGLATVAVATTRSGNLVQPIHPSYMPTPLCEPSVPTCPPGGTVR